MSEKLIPTSNSIIKSGAHTINKNPIGSPLKGATKISQAVWKLIPIETITISTTSPNGFKSSASASVGADVGASVGNEYVGCDIRVWVDVTAVSESYGSAGLNGNNAYVTAGINATVRAETGVAAGVYVGPVAAQGEACVYAETGVRAEMVIEVGENGVKLEGGMSVGSCVGVEGSGTISLSGASATAGSSVSFGDDHFEAGAGGEATFNNGHLNIGVSGDAAVFVGLKFDLAVDVDTNKVIKDAVVVYDTSIKAAKEAEKIANDAAKAAEKLAKEQAAAAEKLAKDQAAAAEKAAKDAANAISNTAKKTSNDIAKGAKKFFSDSRLKENIRLTGKVEGINIYSYNYKWDSTPQVGVMAQELLTTKYSDAVSVHESGYFQVDYSKLPSLH